MTEPHKRTPSGRFQPGQSGNPAGRSALPAAFKARGSEALEEILRLMTESEDEKIKLKAAQWVADRIYGRAPVSVEVETGGSVNEALAALLLGKAGK